MSSIYDDGKYLESNRTWHAEDSPWKAAQIERIILKNGLRPTRIVEIGCGAGGILYQLSIKGDFAQTSFTGYDISPQAIALASGKESARLKFFNEDLLKTDATNRADILLLIDVFEHVEDYLGFLKASKEKAEYKVFHIPLDIHVSSVLRGTFDNTRRTVGHIHYFTAESALASLRDAGYHTVDHFYTNPAFGLYRQHPSAKRAVANVPRWLVSRISVPWAARLFGGYSLLVLAT